MLKKNIDLNGKTVLVTGAAGFIGAALTERLLKNYETTIIGVDNMNSYYDVRLKEDRLARLNSILSSSKGSFSFIKGDISDKRGVDELFDSHKPDLVVNLAAQAGVRYSIENPDAYIQSNVIGFYNILEFCRHNPVSHLVYASSSSVYGGNTKVPFSTEDKVDSPVSLYAATKKADELFAHAYSRLYGIPATGLRFFTVYGPAGRPDMAYFSFAEKLSRGEKINIFNYGNCRRDFTYIDDIVRGVELVMQSSPLIDKNGVDGKDESAGTGVSVASAPTSSGSEGVSSCLVSKKPVAHSASSTALSAAPCRVYNIGGGQPENLMDFVRILAEELRKVGVLSLDFNLRDHINLVPMQPGDVETTFADSSALERDFGFRPSITLREGLSRFAAWYAENQR